MFDIFPADLTVVRFVGTYVIRRLNGLVKELFFKLTSIEEIDADVELTDQGLDSMSVTELFSQLETTLKIDIDPDIIFEHPLPDQLIDKIHSMT